MNKDEVIPIDSRIEEFKDYLFEHPRAIFSAGFGEGKSYFLSNFQKCTGDVFEFITLYPVNYQVASNQDIFKLIKRDILFQLFAKGILTASHPIAKSVAMSFFLAHPRNIIKQFTEWLLELDYPSELSSTVMKRSIQCFRLMKNQFDTYCKEHTIPEGETMAEVLYDCLEKDGIYECDAITQMIQKGIENWKNEYPQKRIVLLVEDLDRIDPAHIFRILNILSAHIDYGYKFLCPVPKIEIVGNKFGFDNVVCVVDHRNLQNIYHHFYGQRTSWNGYIEKFSSNGFFEYSLSDLKYNHFVRLISKGCGLSEEVVRLLVSKEILVNETLRSLNSCLHNVNAQIKEIKPFEGNKRIYWFSKNLLQLCVILQRLGKSKTEMCDTIFSKMQEHEPLIKYILSFYYTKYSDDEYSIYLGEKSDGYDVRYNIHPSDTKGDFTYSRTLYSGNNYYNRKETFKSLIMLMLSYIKVG